MKIIKKPELKTSSSIAIITSRFNQEVTAKLETGALARLKEQGVPEDKITVVNVPGAVEIPLIAQQLAKTNAYDALICLGAVIRGETSHYDYVCEQVSQGCQRVALDHNLPVIFGVLTTENEEQAFARLGGAHGHKGIEAADAALEMIAVLNEIHKLHHR